MLGTAGAAATFFSELVLIDIPVLADKKRLSYISSVRNERRLEDLPREITDCDGWR